MARRVTTDSPRTILAERSTTNTPAPSRRARTQGPPDASSDKENRTARGNRVHKMASLERSVTPVEVRAARGEKRKRLEVPSATVSRGNTPATTRSVDDEEEPEDVKFYDPAQDENVRRDTKRRSRALERRFLENREEYLKSENNGLRETVVEANDIFRNVKQTSEATVDSRLMVNVSDLAYKKSAQMVLGDSATGIDLDEFVSRCIYFMKQHGETTVDDDTATQRRPQRQSRGSPEDIEVGEGEVLDWEVLGRRACCPHNIRPAVPGFLLGPLSVQKKVRAPTQRRARQQNDNANEARPENLTLEDLETNENNTVRTICGKIKSRLVQHCSKAGAAIEASVGDADDEERVKAAMRKYRLSDTGGPSLFDFVINPHSFGQTVENMFYVSFLIKEGELGIDMDSDGLPTLLPNSETMHESRQRNAVKHQAVFGLDYATWQQLIQAFEIKEPLIPHRQEESSQVGARGWYS